MTTIHISTTKKKKKIEGAFKALLFCWDPISCVAIKQIVNAPIISSLSRAQECATINDEIFHSYIVWQLTISQKIKNILKNACKSHTRNCLKMFRCKHFTIAFLACCDKNQASFPFSSRNVHDEMTKCEMRVTLQNIVQLWLIHDPTWSAKFKYMDIWEKLIS